MIGSLRGTVLERSLAGEVVVETGGVGYRVLVPVSAVPALEPDTPAFLFTHLHVRDDTMLLYGFPSRDERQTFEALLGASGVGPKLALAVLSVLDPGALRRALVDDDEAALTAVPGVGPRTAKRLLLELKTRLDVPDFDLAEPTGDGVSARTEVRAALAELGYGTDEIRDVLARVDESGPTETMLREALRLLAARV